MGLFNFLRYKSWLRQPLEDSALSLLEYALKDNKEHEFLDFKRDFFTERSYQTSGDKANSEQLTKNSISYLLERYSVAFANHKGGFLVVGVSEDKKGFRFHGINYKNIKRKKLLTFLNSESLRIETELKINISFISLRIKSREVFIFKINEGNFKPHRSSLGKYFIRRKDETLDLTLKKS